jgi:hypothetical protein
MKRLNSTSFGCASLPKGSTHNLNFGQSTARGHFREIETQPEQKPYSELEKSSANTLEVNRLGTVTGNSAVSKTRASGLTFLPQPL